MSKSTPYSLADFAVLNSHPDIMIGGDSMQKPTKRSLIAPSARRFVQESRKVPGFRLFDLLHGYF